MPILLDWVNAAILSAAAMGIVNILDSYLVSRRMPSLRAYLVPVALIYIVYGLILFALFPLPDEVPLMPMLAAIASALLRTGAVSIMLYIMKKEEVSRIIPIVYTYPIFVAILAIPLLGESLHALEWLAIFIVVAGAIMVSIKQSPTGKTTWLSKPLPSLFGSSLCFAMADIASKYALNYISFWNLSWIGTFCMVGIFLIASLRSPIWQQLRQMKRRNSTLGLIVFNESLAMVGVILMLQAIERGPVSLVSTIIGSRPVFVFILALILSRFLPDFLEWQRGKRILALRLMATAMIVSGIAIIHLY